MKKFLSFLVVALLCVVQLFAQDPVVYDEQTQSLEIPSKGTEDGVCVGYDLIPNRLGSGVKIPLKNGDMFALNISMETQVSGVLNMQIIELVKDNGVPTVSLLSSESVTEFDADVANTVGGTLMVENDQKDVDNDVAFLFTFTPTTPDATKPSTIFTGVEFTVSYMQERMLNLTFVLNEGSFEDGYLAPDSYKEGEIVEFPIPFRENYLFKGWFTNETLSGNPKTSTNTADKSDLTLYAKWEAETYSVEFETNEGSFTNTNVFFDSYVYGKEEVLPEAQDIAREFFTFGGWYDNFDFEGEPITKITATDSGKKVFYAKWIRNTHKLVLELNGGEFEEGQEIFESYAEGEETSLPIPFREHYLFKGWYKAADFSGNEESLISISDNKDLTFYAKWEAEGYEILFEQNEGTFAENVVSGYRYGENVILPTNIVRQYFTFGGWYDNFDFEGEPITEIATTDFGDKTFYAKWNEVRHAINFELNGGIFAEECNSYPEGQEFSLPTPIKDGFVFAGWFETADFSGDQVDLIPNDATAEFTFYAQWTESVAYNLTLNANGGTILGREITAYTQNVYLELPQVEKNGYSFVGWYDNAELTGDVYTGIYEGETGNKEFWAAWEVAEYEVVLETDGGEFTQDFPSYYTYGEAVTLPIPVKTGYKFLGWFDNENFEGNSITEITAIDFGDKKFYAQWKIETYQVTLVLNEGTLLGDNVTSYTYGETVDLPTIEKEGSVFAGWYINEKGEGDSYTVIGEGETGDKTFYAKWKEAEVVYNITYVTNGGQFTETVQNTYVFGKGLKLSIAIEKDGATFDGWYESADFSDAGVSSISAKASGDKTFYAKWIYNIGGMYFIINEAKGTAQVTWGDEEYKGTIVIPEQIECGEAMFTVTSIGAGAFELCGITSITIPKTITEIGEYAFDDCRKLGTVTFNGTMEEWLSITFVNKYSNPMYYAKQLNVNDPEPTTEVEIPEGTTSITGGSYVGMPAVTSVKIPESTTEIDEGAFANNSNLKDITLPAALEKLGAGTFEGCESLVEMVIPELISIIGEETFKGCIGLEDITLPEGLETIGSSAFEGCESLMEVLIPATVEAIQNGAFKGCKELANLYFGQNQTILKADGNALKTIGDEAFADCENLETLVVPEGTETIGASAFANCVKLQTVALPSTLKTVGEKAFSQCSAIKSLKVAATVPPTITANTFEGVNTNITVIVPKGSKVAYQNDANWKAFTNIVEDGNVAVESVSNEVIIFAKRGEIVCNVDFQIFNVAGQNLTNQNGQLPIGVYFVVTQFGAKTVEVK